MYCSHRVSCLVTPVATTLLSLFNRILNINRKLCQYKIYTKMNHFIKGCRSMFPNSRSYNMYIIYIEINILEYF